jgi:hypothetical protein
LAVREDDAEPEPLEDESMELEDGDIVAMAVKVGSVLSATISTDLLHFTCCFEGPAVVVAVIPC